MYLREISEYEKLSSLDVLGVDDRRKNDQLDVLCDNKDSVVRTEGLMSVSLRFLERVECLTNERFSKNLESLEINCHNPSATRHNIYLYPYFLFAAIHPLKSSPTFSMRPCSSVGRVTVDLIRRSWVRFPPRSKDFFFASCGSLFPFTRTNAQWVIHGFKVAL